MAKKYLNHQFNAIGIDKDLKDYIQATLLEAFETVSDNLRNQHGKKQSKKNISKEFQLKNDEKSLSPYTKSFRDKNSLEFLEKLQESKAIALKFIKDKKDRERKRQEREEILLKKQAEILESQEKNEEQLRVKQQQEKLQKLEKLKEVKDKRLKEMEYYRSFNQSTSRISLSATPLYRKIEQNYFHEKVLPNLEKIKKDLQLKKEMFKPISLKEIIQHARKVDLIKTEYEEKRKKELNLRILDTKINIAGYNLKSKFIENILQEEKKIKEAEIQKEQEKKQRIEKKKKYSEIVNEMFQPSIDKFKQHEMKLIKARLEFPVKIKSSLLSSKTEKSSDYFRSVSVQPRKWKKNPMVLDPPKIKQGTKIYYLEERRKLREKNENINKSTLVWDNNIAEITSNEKKIEALKKNAEKLEKQAQKYELKIGAGNMNIDLADHVSELIINSIRAKLAILSSQA
jgi:hypothetical protein